MTKPTRLQESEPEPEERNKRSKSNHTKIAECTEGLIQVKVLSEEEAININSILYYYNCSH